MFGRAKDETEAGGPIVPRLEDSRPAAAAAQRRHDSLQSRLSELEARRTEITSGLNASEALGRAERARALFESDEVTESPGVRLETMRQDLASVRDALRVTGDALQLARQVVERERGQAAAELRPKLLPYRRSLASRYLKALETITEIAEEEETLHDVLREGGWPSHVCGAVVGADFVTPLRFDRDWSVANIWLKDARREGLLDFEDDNTTVPALRPEVLREKLKLEQEHVARKRRLWQQAAKQSAA